MKTNTTLTALTVWLICSTALGATVHNTSDSGSGSLRDAILNAANNEAITFDSGVVGTIVLTNGQLQIKTNLSIVGPGAKVLAVSGNLQSRVFNVDALATNVSISGLTITNGRVTGNPAQGGGIFNGGRLSLSSCRLTHNTAFGDGDGSPGYGGAAWGGGICSTGQLALIACTVDNNYAQGGFKTVAGAAAGAGIYESGGSVGLTNCTLTSNGAEGGSGFAGGNASGGAVYVVYGQCAMVNCTIMMNSVGGGQGNPNEGGPAEGKGLSGGYYGGFAASATLLNTVLCNNFAADADGPSSFADSSWDGLGAFTSLGHNLVGRVYGWSAGPGDVNVPVVFGPNIWNDYPLGFGDLGDNGGGTPTMSISRASPAHDAGDDAVLGSPYFLATDQRGLSRRAPPHVDIGAIEYHLFLTVPYIISDDSWSPLLAGWHYWIWPTFPDPPLPENLTVLLTNSVSKTISITSTDSLSYSNSMSISNLVIAAPAGSSNTLTLASSGLSTPLRVHQSLFLLSGGALSVSNSAIEMNSGAPLLSDAFNGSEAIFDGPAIFRSASLNTSNAYDLAVGNSAPGSLNMTNSTLSAYNLFVACGTNGTANFKNTTALLNRSLVIAASGPITGIVNVVGGSLTATSSNPTNTPSLIMGSGTAQLTISSGAVVQFGSGVLGAPGGSATLTAQSGRLSFAGPLQVENGTLNLQTGATLSLGSSLILATGTNSVAQVNITGGTHTVTNGVLGVGNNGTLTGGSGAGTVTVSNATLRTSVVMLGSTVGGSGNLYVRTSALLKAAGLNVNDAVVDGGQLLVAPDPTVNVSFADPNIVNRIVGGYLRDGIMTVTNNGTASALEIVMGLTNGTGTLNLSSGSVTASNLFAGMTLGSTGVVNVTGGTLNVTNVGGLTLIGPGGSGQLNVSGGTHAFRQVKLGGTTAGASGLLHLFGSGIIKILGNACTACGLSNNDVEVDGGDLDCSQTSMVIGDSHNALLNVTGGTVEAGQLFAGYTPGFTGTFTQSGGVVTVGTNLIVGDCASGAIGLVTLSGSATLYVQNATHTAVLDVRNGTFTLNGGTLVVDTLIVTNPCAHFVKNGGTVVYRQLILDPSLDADGDGVPNGLEQALGMDPLNPSFVCAPAGIVAWWPGAGNARDIIGANNGTLQGAAAYAAGKVGQGFSFDGATGYVDFGTGVGNFGTSDFTAEFWIKTTSARIEYPLGKRPGCGHASFWEARLDTSGVMEVDVDQDTLGNNYLDVVGTHAVNDGVFHHVAMVRQGTSLSLYVDGALDGNGTAAGVAAISNAGSVTAGRDGCSGYNPSLHYFTGVLDEIALYGRALSATEVQAIYLAGAAGKCLPPLYITSKNKAGNNFNVSWLAQEGLVYRLQYKTNLVPAAPWTDVSGDVTAAAASGSKTDVLPGNAPQRYYRVEMLR